MNVLTTLWLNASYPSQMGNWLVHASQRDREWWGANQSQELSLFSAGHFGTNFSKLSHDFQQLCLHHQFSKYPSQTLFCTFLKTWKGLQKEERFQSLCWLSLASKSSFPVLPVSALRKKHLTKWKTTLKTGDRTMALKLHGQGFSGPPSSWSIKTCINICNNSYHFEGFSAYAAMIKVL